jgi:tetratricopeptide (TPR) repeat protein
MMDQQQRERLQRLLTYLEQDPHNPSLLADIATLQFADQQFERARDSAQRANAAAPGQRAAHAVLGLIAVRDGNYAGAADALGQAIALGEIDAAVHFHNAYALASLARYAEAEPSAAAAAAQHAEYPHAPALYLRILHHLGKIDEAVAFAEQLAASGGAAPPRLHGVLSTLYIDVDDIDKARSAAQAALAQDADDTDAHTTLGLLALGDLDGLLAQAEFERVLKVQANHGRATLGSGLSHMLAGDMSTATRALERATQTTNMSTHVGTWHTLAWCYILQGDLDAAEQALQQAMELNRNFAETHGGLAVVAVMRGNIDLATQAAKRAAALNPKNFSGNFAQSLIQQAAGKAELARKIVQRILSQPVLSGGKTLQSVVAEMFAKAEIGRKNSK